MQATSFSITLSRTREWTQAFVVTGRPASQLGGKLLSKILRLLDQNGRRKYLFLALLCIGSSVMQTAGVALISVFFAVLLGGPVPHIVEHFVSRFGLESLGVWVFLISVLGTLSSGFSTYLGIRISWKEYRRIAGELLHKYLTNCYEWHTQQNSADLISAVLSEAHLAVQNILQQVVLIIVRGTELILLAALLFVARPKVAMVSFVAFGFTYFVLYKLSKGAIRHKGEFLVQANIDRLRTVSEALKGIKAVKVAQKGKLYEDSFQDSARRFSESAASIQYLSLMPKYFVEALLFGSIVGFVIVSHTRHWAVYESIPILALFGAAAVRMLPAIQQVYLSVSTMNSATIVLDKILRDLESELHPDPRSNTQDDEHLGCTELVRLERVKYRYPGAEENSLNGIDLSITRGEKLGLVGATGAGKTTLVDIILGLLQPQEGCVKKSAVTGEHSFVSYIPQQLHFLDDTLAANIAWGDEVGDAEMARIVAAANLAMANEFVSELPLGYKTPMGEQGVRLSGGQKQRIGIARALYSRPTLLVLDEASNALDPETERRLLNGLLQQDITMIVIAHRISTLKSCSRILVMSNGKVVGMGPFDELAENNPQFQRLVAADLGEQIIEEATSSSPKLTGTKT